MLISDVIKKLYAWAPAAYQESYDNAQLITGNQGWELKAALVTLDCTEDVVQEAIERKANFIIAHHPIVFKGLKSLTGKNYVERTIIKAIKNDIAIFAIHTNLDNVHNGVNQKICDILGLTSTKILAPKIGTLSKLETFVPNSHLLQLTDALFDAGAGEIGNYDQCSFQIDGLGTFRPNQHASPFVGESGIRSEEKETKVEVLFPNHIRHQIVAALKKAHPYEEVAYYLSDLSNTNMEVGSGMIGLLEKKMPTQEFLQLLKDRFNLSVIKHTHIHTETIEKVAVCGGSGSFLLANAKASGADIFITSDFKYHEFFDAENQIIIADIGHYESEVFTKELICDFLREKIPNIAVNLSETSTNPIKFF